MREAKKEMEAKRPIELIVRDLRGLLTPLTRHFDAIDEYTLNQLLSEIEALSASVVDDGTSNIRNYLTMVKDDMENDEGVREVARTALLLISKPSVAPLEAEKPAIEESETVGCAQTSLQSL